MTPEEIELKQKQRGERSSGQGSRGLWMTGECQVFLMCPPDIPPPLAIEMIEFDVCEDWEIYGTNIQDVENLDVEIDTREDYGWYPDHRVALYDYGDSFPAWEHIAYGAYAFYKVQDSEHVYKHTLQGWFHMYGDGGASADADYYGLIPVNCGIDWCEWHSERY